MASRLLCSVLEEMRKTYETRNFAYLPGLIEEAQVLGNRMEAGLDEKHTAEYYRTERKELEADVKRLRAEKEQLELNKPKKSKK